MSPYRRCFLYGLAVPAIMLLGCAPQADHPRLTADTRTIVGGISVEENSEISASAVLIVADQYPKIRTEFCTGTLIAKNLVLTAAHCVLRDDDPASPVPARQIRLIFGNAQFDPTSDTDPVKNERAQKSAFKVVFHEKHIGHNLDPDINDIALIQFRGELPSGLRPASILPLTQAQVPLEDRAEVEVAGFGVTGSGDPLEPFSLRQTELVTVSDEGDSIFQLSSSQLEPRAICSGDSGGPSFVEIDDTQYLWAIHIQSDCRSKSWVLNLSSFHGWIKKKAKDLQVEGLKI